MAPMKNNNNNNRSSSTRGGNVAAALRQANILASCYVVDPAAASGAALRGLHYCTSLAAGAECPPLAAITATNELALTPKAKSSSAAAAAAGGRVAADRRTSSARRGGATSRIRGECERFFCETLRAAFLGEGSAAERVSRLTDVYHHHDHHHYHNDDDNHHRHNDRYGSDGRTPYDGPPGGASRRAAVDANGQLTPPDHYYFPLGGNEAATAQQRTSPRQRKHHGGGNVAAWLEIWDYAGGNSFRGFVAAQNENENESDDDGGDDAKTLFVFFDANVVGRDLKQALVALIELAEGPLGCEHMVIAVDRGIAEEDAKPLLTGLQWAGFSITTLDYWTGGMDVTSPKWLFMGMEL